MILHCLYRRSNSLHRRSNGLKYTEENVQDVNVDKGEFKIIKESKEHVVKFG